MTRPGEAGLVRGAVRGAAWLGGLCAIAVAPYISGYSLYFLSTALYTEATPLYYKIALPAGMVGILVLVLLALRQQRRRDRAAAAENGE